MVSPPTFAAVSGAEKRGTTMVVLLTVMILNVIQLKFTGMLDKEGK